MSTFNAATQSYYNPDIICLHKHTLFLLVLLSLSGKFICCCMFFMRSLPCDSSNWQRSSLAFNSSQQCLSASFSAITSARSDRLFSSKTVNKLINVSQRHLYAICITIINDTKGIISNLFSSLD